MALGLIHRNSVNMLSISKLNVHQIKLCHKFFEQKKKSEHGLNEILSWGKDSRYSL